MPHAVVFVVAFQVYAHYFTLKFNCNEFDGYKKLVKFQAEKFLMSGYFNYKNFRLQFLRS